MKRLPMTEKMFIVANFRDKPIKEIATTLGKNPKTVNNWLNQRGYKKRPNYTKEQELAILKGDSIQGKSKNAIKIKRWRLKNACSKSNC